VPGWAWAILAGLAFGISQLSNRGVNREIDALRAITAMVTTLLGFLIAAIVVSGDITDLPDMTAMAVFWFAAAGLIHFLAGWTIFAFSQQRIGPSRTSSILAINPVMATGFAYLLLSENLRSVTWLGVLTVTAGVVVVTSGRLTSGRWTNPTLALLAVTVPAMHVSSRLLTGQWVSVPRGIRHWLLSGGFAAAVALIAQWKAFALIPIGVAISLQQVSTPVVIFLGPRLLSVPSERATPRLLSGTALVIAGSTVVALFGRSL
jgi:drug/metabolite transporter (DMT)-like permease